MNANGRNGGERMAAEPAVLGLHHVTAITARAADNVTFYTQVLGLRLVKKTVNQDDVAAYHLFYGDETGGPGTELTFFHWPQAGRDVPGSGTVAHTAFTVPSGEAIAWWRERLERFGVGHGEVETWDGRAALAFADPEGQRLALVAGERPGVRPWAGSPVPPEVAVHGLDAVTLHVAEPGPTVEVLAGLLGFRRAGGAGGEAGGVVLESGAGGPGTEVRVVVPQQARRGWPGIGGVHHVAFRTPDDAAQQAWLRRLQGSGLRHTPIIDRYYFRSIYFREPGGVLFEIATDGPGFATDEPAEHLGERLALPPFLEPRRAEIEAGLPPL